MIIINRECESGNLGSLPASAPTWKTFWAWIFISEVHWTAGVSISLVVHHISILSSSLKSRKWLVCSDGKNFWNSDWMLPIWSSGCQNFSFRLSSPTLFGGRSDVGKSGRPFSYLSSLFTKANCSSSLEAVDNCFASDHFSFFPVVAPANSWPWTDRTGLVLFLSPNNKGIWLLASRLEWLRCSYPLRSLPTITY